MKDPVTEVNTALIKLLVAIVVLTLTAFFSYRYGLDVGETKEKAQWQEREKKFTDAEILLRKEHGKKVAKLVELHQQSNLKNTYDHENALDKVRTELAAARAESRRLGGLRIAVPASACRGPEQGSTGAQTAGASQRDEATTLTIALPERVEANLWSIAGQADEVLEQARACQAWITANGFYGKDPAKAD